MVQTMEIKPELEDATREDMSQSMIMGLGQILGKTSKALKNMPDGSKGKILSHGITRIGRHLIVSFLVCSDK